MEISCLNKNVHSFAPNDHPSLRTLTMENKRFDSEKIVGETRLFQELSIAYKWMSFSGLLYLQNATETTNKRTLLKKKLYTIYQWVFDAFIVMNALRFFALYRYFQDMGSLLVGFVNHTFLGLIVCLACMRPCLEKRISLFIHRIFNHKMNNQDVSSINRLSNCIRFYVLFICTYSLLSSIGYNLIAPPFNSGSIVSQTYPFTKDSHFFYPALLLFGVVITIGSLRVYVMIAHCFAMCHFLTLEYIHLAKTVRSQLTAIKDDDGHFLEDQRARFESVNCLLKHVNRISNISLMLILFFCIFELCMMIYGLLQFIEEIDFYSISLSAGFGTLFTVLLIGTGIFLSSSAHQLTDDLYQIDLRNLSSEASLKVSIFLTRLTSSPIGISVAGLFVIDHSTILMLSGTLLTYIIVVIQTKAPECKCQSGNDTNITALGI